MVKPDELKKLRRASGHAASKYSISGHLKEGGNAPKKVTLTRRKALEKLADGPDNADQT